MGQEASDRSTPYTQFGSEDKVEDSEDKDEDGEPDHSEGNAEPAAMLATS